MPNLFRGRRWMRTAAMAFCLAAAGCDLPPESRSALSDGPTVDYDERMIGNWALLMDKDPLYLKISKTAQPKRLQAVITMLSRTAAGWGHFTAHPTKIGGTIYYNAKRTKGKGQDYTAPGEKPGYMIIRPIFAGRDVMVICTLHAQSVTNHAAAKMLGKYGMRTRKVTGMMDKDKAEYLALDVSQKELRRLVAMAPPGELFGGFMPFVRLGAPAGTMRGVLKKMKDRRKTGKKGCPFEWAR